MSALKETLVLNNGTYTITVIDGNHGGWLFVALNDKTIYEQSGYKELNQETLKLGIVYAHWHSEQEALPKPDLTKSKFWKKD